MRIYEYSESDLGLQIPKWSKNGGSILRTTCYGREWLALLVTKVVFHEVPWGSPVLSENPLKYINGILHVFGALGPEQVCFRRCVIFVLVFQVVPKQFRAIDRAVLLGKFPDELPGERPGLFGSSVITPF